MRNKLAESANIVITVRKKQEEETRKGENTKQTAKLIVLQDVEARTATQ
jgi:hypothetical protein